MLGSFASPDPAVRQMAISHAIDAIDIARRVNSKLLSLWFPDGTNYPGQDNIRNRKRHFTQALQECHNHLDENQRLLVEYKPFEPAFYHTDIADWGMAYLLAKAAGPRAKVLVDTGHHYLSQNIEQIVAWLLDEKMLGGFHFNDRRYADDDLTLGSIDPYQIFRIFHEIHGYAADQGGAYPEISYVVDQCHNIKPKIEAMLQTVTTAQQLYAKAALVNHEELSKHQSKGQIVDAEEVLKKAFNTDVTGAIAEWRRGRGLGADPLAEHRASGYAQDAARDRRRRREEMGIKQTVCFV
jgi:L-rhamnose isomerase/sugar isomerase